MVYVDVSRVRGKMAERGYTICSLAEELGVSRNTLSSYLKTPEKMPYAIVSDMAGLLCDSPAEASSIFFTANLRRA